MLYSPKVYVERGGQHRLPIEGENVVEFYLLYSGELHSDGNRDQKHAIRKVFHSQLGRLWHTNQNLRQLAVMEGMSCYARETAGIENPPQLSDDDAVEKGLADIGRNWNRNGFNFVPLVTKQHCLRCRLDILFLRMEERNYVLQGGDIDGRLKTLFDAIRPTKSRDELPTGAAPERGETPFFCLLEDDSLISEVRVVADQLLRLPEARAANQHDVYLEIKVSLNPTGRSKVGWAF
jgi:hypothetical protein